MTNVLPDFVFDFAIEKIKEEIKKRANFSIDDLDMRTYIKYSKCPALFIGSKQDKVVKHKSV